MNKKRCEKELCKSVVKFALMCCAIVLCCVFMSNVGAKVSCVLIVGLLNVFNLYDILKMSEVLGKMKKLTLLANIELKMFREWQKSHPDCDVVLYQNMREKEMREKY